MNKYGYISLLLVAVNIVIFLIFRGPDANGYVMSIVIGLLSLLGIVAASISKKAVSIIPGVLLNSGTLLGAFLLLLAMGIGEK